MIRKLSGQKAVCAALALIMSASMFSAGAADARTGPLKVNYAELEKLVKAQSPRYLMAAETYGQTQDYVQSAIDSLPVYETAYYQTKASLEAHYAEYQAELAKDEGERNYEKLNYLRTSIAAEEMAIKSYDDGIENSYDVIITASDNNDASERNLRVALTSATTSARQLFIGLRAMDQSIAIARLSLDSLNARLPGMNTKYNLGLVSKTQLDDFKDGIETMKTAISDLETMRRSTEINMKLFLGIKVADSIELGDLPEMDLAQITKLSYTADKEKYAANCNDIISAKKTLDDVSPGKQAHTSVKYATARITLNQTTESVEASFDKDYQALKDGYRDYLKKEEDIKKLEKEASDLDLKYGRGIVSKRELEDKKSDLQKAKLENEAARLDLCSMLVAYQDKLAAVWKI